MATVAFGVAGALIGGAVGGPKGAQIGWAAGTLVGGALFPPKLSVQQKGRLDDLRVTGSGYGAAIPQIYGCDRVGGNVIWATDLQEHVSHHGGGKGARRPAENTYTYTINALILLCRGPSGQIKRIWGEDRIVYDSSTGATTEIQIVTKGSNTGGTLALEFRGHTTIAIAHNASAATVQADLEALLSIGAGNVLVSGSSGGPWTVNFTGTLGGVDLPAMTMHSSLTGGSGAKVTVSQQGGRPTNIEPFLGKEDQMPWSVIEDFEGVGNVPAYRGVTCFGLDDYDLSPWGGRMPAWTAEVCPVFTNVNTDFILAYKFESGARLTNTGTAAGEFDLSRSDICEA